MTSRRRSSSTRRAGVQQSRSRQPQTWELGCGTPGLRGGDAHRSGPEGGAGEPETIRSAWPNRVTRTLNTRATSERGGRRSRWYTAGPRGLIRELLQMLGVRREAPAHEVSDLPQAGLRRLPLQHQRTLLLLPTVRAVLLLRR